MLVKVVVVLVLGLFGIVEVVVVLVLVFFLVFGVGLGLGSGGCGGSGGNVLVTVALLPSLQLFLLLSAFCRRHLCSPSMLLLQSDPYRQSVWAQHRTLEYHTPLFAVVPLG